MTTSRNTWLSFLTQVLLFGAVRTAVIQPSPHLHKKQTARIPKIAVLGDSYGSGLAYLDSNRYKGNNDDNCYRWDQAYAAQLEANKDLAFDGVDMQFVACTGSKLIDLAKGTQQISKVDNDRDLIILTAGGNNAFFYEVASNCIFHDKFPRNYGPLYPDETGECFKSIQRSRNYITSKLKGPGVSLDFDLRATYDDLLGTDAYKSSNLHTYHTGYIHFFNTEEDGDWCESSKETFDIVPSIVPGVSHQPLTRALRSDINQLVEDYNNALKTVLADYADKKFSYVEISSGFTGHRFCEKGSDHSKQYYDSNVWLWNVSPPLPDDVAAPGNGVPLDPYQAELEPVYQSGLWNTSTTASPGASSAKTGAGWTLRPMHPKKDGYTAIRKAIIDKMVQDQIFGGT